MGRAPSRRSDGGSYSTPNRYSNYEGSRDRSSRSDSRGTPGREDEFRTPGRVSDPRSMSGRSGYPRVSAGRDVSSSPAGHGRSSSTSNPPGGSPAMTYKEWKERKAREKAAGR